MFELQYGCCDRDGKPQQLLAKKYGLMHYVSNPEAPDVAFDFLASLTVDELNNAGDNPVDGLEPISAVQPGPALGPFSIGIDATISGGNFLDEVTYTIDEVDCIGFPTPITIFETTVFVPDGNQPENFLFLDQFTDPNVIDPQTGEETPWFAVVANTEDKCFRATVTVANQCGSFSNSSYFTITEDCYYCFTNDDGNGFIELVQPPTASTNLELSLIHI